MKTRSETSSLSIFATTIAVLTALVLPSGKAHAQNQPLLQITSPADGTVVAPGQTVTVVVTPASGSNFSLVGLLGENPIGTDQVLATPPFQFSLAIPSPIAAAKKYSIFASGVISPGQGAESDPISLDVEPAVPVTKLAVQPSQINFRSAGEQIPLTVTGTFSDGSLIDITQSSLISYSSNDTRIATVDNNGVVTAVGTAAIGATGIIVRFGNLSVPIPVSTVALSDVTPPVTTAKITPAPNAAGWNNTNVTVNLTSMDNELGGTGVSQIQFSLSGAQTSQLQMVSGNTASVPISTEGVTTVTYFGTDNAGNAELPKALVVRIDKTPPAINVTANPTILWPPDGKTIPVTISGAITDATSGVDPSTPRFAVTDTEGLIQPAGSVTVNPTGQYSFTISLEASRPGNDLNGRTYTVVLTASDIAGNTASSTATVHVPHDQGNH